MVTEIHLALIIYWILPSIIASLGVMAACELTIYKLEFFKALAVGFGANIVPTLMNAYYTQLAYLIPYGYIRLGNISLASMIVNVIIWIRLSMFVMSDANLFDKIKIGVLGFTITQILILLNSLLYV